MAKAALFLDRDGVININHGYVHQKENFDFIEGIFEVVSNAKQLGYLVIVVTNQAGIGRGYYSENDFYLLTEWMCQQFEANGSRIDKVYFCPDHPTHGIGHYRKESYFRKPAPGMILQAATEFDLDLENSILIGDKPSDYEAGLAAGVGKLFYFGSNNENSSVIQIKHLTEILPYLHSQS